ncbi:uncharacterized protein LOC108742904 [Agrilus planipennis]|uniref:Uncharacterized protein LOC108742904 n=1 Tax=Agrilus planipennis TaxID=224129 RepID=A0A1W4XN02_AGRPL|nr:uncharacterized protein LOC108742904 [Agrilus planipennis]
MATNNFFLVFSCVLIASVCALPATDKEKETARSARSENDLLDATYTDCLRKDTVSCIKYKIFSFVDKMLDQKDAITVTDGVSLVKVEGAEPEGAPRALTADDTVESVIFNKVQRFLQTHTLKVDIKGSDIVSAVSSTARSFNDAMDGIYEEDNMVEESRGKKKKVQKLLGPIMAALGLVGGILTKLALGKIALIAGKALLIGKIALVLSAIIGLKKLLGQGKHVTYEVVAHPQHSASHIATHETVHSSGGGGGYGGDIGGGYGGGSSGHGGWGRTFDAQDLAYRAHVPKSTEQ